MNNNRYLLGLALQVISIIVLLLIDWRIACCLFVWQMGVNWINRADLNEEVQALKYHINYVDISLSTFKNDANSKFVAKK